MHRSRLWTRTLSLLTAAAVAGACASDGGRAPDEVASADASRARAHHSVGATHLRDGRIALAIRELRAAEQLNPQDKWIQLALAEAYRRKNLSEDSERHLLKALAVDPSFQDARLTLSGLYIQMERYPQAVEHAQFLIDDPTFPKPWEALSNKGYALMMLDRRAEAREALLLALEYHDRYWRAQLNLGILDAQEGKRLDAMERFERVLGLGAGPLAVAEVNYRMAEIYLSLGNRERAVEHWVAASSQRPSGTWGKRSEDRLKSLR
jgi:tetratricopeptide (TPR) repeat protein